MPSEQEIKELMTLCSGKDVTELDVQTVNWIRGLIWTSIAVAALDELAAGGTIAKQVEGTAVRRALRRLDKALAMVSQVADASAYLDKVLADETPPLTDR